MTLIAKLLVIGAGGGLGAAFRHMLVSLFHGPLQMPTFSAVMVVNILGSFLIGLTFLLIETRYSTDGQSRLQELSISDDLNELDGWPEGDPTLPAVDVFRFQLSAQLLSGFLITGVLGGMTTFSLFSMLTLNLLQSGQIGWALFNAFGTVLLGFLAAQLGFRAGCALTLRQQRLQKSDSL